MRRARAAAILAILASLAAPSPAATRPLPTCGTRAETVVHASPSLRDWPTGRRGRRAHPVAGRNGPPYLHAAGDLRRSDRSHLVRRSHALIWQHACVEVCEA